MPALDPLYLPALIKGGTLIFGDCNCGELCSPYFNFSVNQSLHNISIPGAWTAITDSLAEVVRRVPRPGGGWNTATDSVSGTSQQAQTIQLEGYRKRVFCEVSPDTDGYARLVAAGSPGAFNFRPIARAEFSGVHQGGFATEFTTGSVWELGLQDEPITVDFTASFSGNVCRLSSGCARYFVEYGCVAVLGSTRPQAYGITQRTVGPACGSVEWTETSNTLQLPAFQNPGDTAVVSFWVYARCWLDPQYDQGLIDP